MTMRTEHDSMGDVEVPASALYQAQTQRALNNFTIQRARTLPVAVVQALLDIKTHAAQANAELGKLSPAKARAVQQAREYLAELSDEALQQHFPLTVFQTGSGTSSNMNANEVLATLASRELTETVHPNDDVNCSQSSNDVFPSALQIAAVRAVDGKLNVALEALQLRLQELVAQHASSVKNGRTHLMDAMPVTFGMELAVWREQMMQAQQRILTAQQALLQLPLGGTAVGTGVNASTAFARAVVKTLREQDGLEWQLLALPGVQMSGQEASLALASACKSLAIVLTRVANDLRWMNSGPMHGLKEIQLPALQPGSSIMPAKINPVIPEAVLMAMMEVMANEQAVTLAAQSGNFQLNVALPLIADKLLSSIELLAESVQQLHAQVFHALQFNAEYCRALVDKNPILVTALNEEIGYELAAKIAKQAQQEGRSIMEVAQEHCDLSHERLQALLDPLRLAQMPAKRT